MAGLTSSVQLIEASHQGDVKRALLLLTERRAKADAYNNRALHIAISKGFHEIVHILLQHGAQIDPMLTTEVAQLGRMELLKLLLKYNGGTVHHRAISEAARSGHFHIVQYLLDLSKVNKKFFGIFLKKFSGLQSKRNLPIRCTA